MTQNDITRALGKLTGGQAFITSAQLTRALGCADQYKVKKEYLSGLEAVNGKYYLIREVAAELKRRAKPT